MILDTLDQVKSLTQAEKAILAQELLDDLNAPVLSSDQDQAILAVLNARCESYLADSSSGRSWETVKATLQEKTGASWQK